MSDSFKNHGKKITILIAVWMMLMIVGCYSTERTDMLDEEISVNQNDIVVENEEQEDSEQENSEEKDISTESVSNEILYGCFLPEHCSKIEIANEDVVTNAFEKKEWSTYISFNGDVLTLSKLPLLWEASEMTIDVISVKKIDDLNSRYGVAAGRSYNKIIREVFGDHDFVTVTYYDVNQNLYDVNCVYKVSENALTLSMIHYNKETRKFSLIPMEEYQVVREQNEVTFYKDESFVKTVPYILSEQAEEFTIEAFAENKTEIYNDIVGIVYYNTNVKNDSWPLKGFVYFVDGSRAINAVFDFSEKDKITISWTGREIWENRQLVKSYGFEKVTFDYQIVQDTGLILERDGQKYYYPLNVE